jgi:hypothetical protein
VVEAEEGEEGAAMLVPQGAKMRQIKLNGARRSDVAEGGGRAESSSVKRVPRDRGLGPNLGGDEVDESIDGVR